MTFTSRIFGGAGSFYAIKVEIFFTVRTGLEILSIRDHRGWLWMSGRLLLVAPSPSESQWVCVIVWWCDGVSVPAVTGLSPAVVSVLSRLLPPPPPTPPLLWPSRHSSSPSTSISTPPYYLNKKDKGWELLLDLLFSVTAISFLSTRQFPPPAVSAHWNIITHSLSLSSSLLIQCMTQPASKSSSCQPTRRSQVSPLMPGCLKNCIKEKINDSLMQRSLSPLPHLNCCSSLI